MYYRAFGLQKNPFSLTPDPAFLFLTPQHREALVGLTYAILQCKGFVALTGDPGTGKTTLVSRALQFMPANRLQSSAILHPTLTPSEFIEMVLLDFGVSDVPASKAQRLHRLQELLFEGQRNGKISALIIDEAQKLSPEVLEEIRLLGNLEQSDRKLLQILLVGQSEFDDNLNRAELRQLKQRIALRLRIGPLGPDEVGHYIRHRWSVAGGTQSPFSAAAVCGVASISRGIPRLINSLCENALTLACADGLQVADAHQVSQAAIELRLDSNLHRSAPLSAAGIEALREFKADAQNGEPPARTAFSRWAVKLGFSPADESAR